MERNEQKRVMREKIMQSAIRQFEKEGYEAASMNDICKSGNISKGIIYHYFKDKDDLYLACVKACYDALLDYYAQHRIHKDCYLDIKSFMEIRVHFFKEHEIYRKLFFHSFLSTPDHLKKQVAELQKPLDELNISIYKAYLQRVELREHMDMEKAVMYLELIQNAYHDYFRKESEECEDYDELIASYERQIPDFIDMMLYGIARKENTL